MVFDLKTAVPVMENEGNIERKPDFDISSAKPYQEPVNFDEMGQELGKASRETGAMFFKAIRWPFWRFIEHPVSTIVSAAQEPEGKTVGGTISKAIQSYVPFRQIPKEEYGTYGNIWNNYYKSIMNEDAPDWYIAIASYGTAMGVEPPAIKFAGKAAELALTRPVTIEEADIIKKTFEPLKTRLEQGGLNTQSLYKDGNIIKLSEDSELFLNKYATAVLRGDKIRVPRWAVIKKPPIIPQIEANAPEALPLTGKKVILRPIEKLPEVPKIAPKITVPEEVRPTLEKIRPDLTGVMPLQRQIQSMTERLERVNMARLSLQELDAIRENFKGRIRKYKEGYLKEELGGIPKYYVTKEGGIYPDEAMQELRESFGVELANESELKEYLINTEKARKDLQVEIKTNKSELLTKRETTLLNQRIKATEQGLREGRIQTKEEIKSTQEELISLIEEAKLPLEERAKFIKTIKNIQTKEQLAKKLPEITERLKSMKEKELRDELVGEIKKISQGTKTSEMVAVEYSQLIQDVVNQFELQGHRVTTIKELQNTMEYIKKSVEEGKKLDMPEDILDKLGILYRKPLKDIGTFELEELRDTIEHLANLGITKLRLRQIAYDKKKIATLNRLKAGSVAMQSEEKLKANIGEKLSFSDTLKNVIAEKINQKMEKSISLTPMDAFIDELDGQKNYKGENYTTFKKSIDKDWNEYHKLYREFYEKVIKLSENMTEQNFERIAAWSILQEISGIDKIEALGYKLSDIENIILTDKEKTLLDEMVKNYDKSFPMIREVMRTVYNKPLNKVNFYYPYITDFEAMSDFEIRDRFVDIPEYTKALRKNPEMGFTKERIGGKQKIIVNALEAYLRHMDNVAYLLTVGKDIRYLNEVAASNEYREAVGDIGQEMMREWLDLIARKGRLAGERIPLLDTLRKYTSGANLAFKLSSALIQPTALFDGAAMIGNHAFDGVQMVCHKKIRKFLIDNFEEVRLRVGDDPAFMDFYNKRNIIDEAINIGLYPLKALDKLTASAITIGAYKKYCIENNIEFDISKPNQDAIDYAQIILRRTQSSALFKDISLSLSKGKLTGNLSFDRALLQFQSFILNRWSLITHDLYKAGIKGDNKTQALNIAFWLIVATISETLIRRGIRDMWNKDHTKGNDKTLAQDLLLNAAQNIPFVGNVIGMIFYGSSGLPSIDYINNIFEEVGFAWKSKKKKTRVKHYERAFVSGFPGGSQIKQIFLNKKKHKVKVR